MTHNNSNSGCNYVWVEDNSLKDFDAESEVHKTKIIDVSSGKNTGERIYVYNHHKNKYVNNELFLCLMSDFINGIDHTKGVYSGGNQYGQWNPSNNVIENDNYTLVKKWRETNTVTVMTKNPQNITCKDVDNADFIIINNTLTDGSYDVAYKINAYARGDLSSCNANFIKGDNDISADVMKRIYKHVVVDEDVAIAVSQSAANRPTNFNTNVGHLGCMLFYVQNKKENDKLSNGDTVCGTGRDFFRNLLFDYGPLADGNGRDNNNTIVNINGNPVTNYMYINEYGDLIIGGYNYITNNGEWYTGRDEFYRTWLYNNDLRSYFYDGYVDEWIYNPISGENVRVEGDRNFTGLGYYFEDSSGNLIPNSTYGKYKNQIFYSENHSLFSDMSDGASAIRSINSSVDHRTEHFVDSDIKEKKSFFLSMNIVNGDSVTPEKTDNLNKNKTLYINKYELKDMGDSYVLPIDIKIVTSHPITNITVSKTNRAGLKIGSDIATYVSSTGVLKGDDSHKVSLGSLPMTDETEYDAEGNAPYIAEKDYYKYSLSGTIELPKRYFETGSNNTITVTATNSVDKSASDMITIVTRDFFGLN